MYILRDFFPKNGGKGRVLRKHVAKRLRTGRTMSRCPYNPTHTTFANAIRSCWHNGDSEMAYRLQDVIRFGGRR